MQIVVPVKREYKPLRDIRSVRRGSWFGGERTLRDYSDVEFEWYGCVINPKLMRPYFVGAVGETSYNEGKYVIYVPTTDLANVEVVGAGHFETNSYSNYAAPARITGYPRIHTPAGVAEKGTGLGNVLYTGGCVVGSHLVVGSALGKVRPTIDRDQLENAGCSSGPGASSSARAWWAGAASRGLAVEVTGTSESEREWDTVTLDYETEQDFDLDEWYRLSSVLALLMTRAQLSDMFDRSYYQDISYTVFDHPFEETESIDSQGYSIHLSEDSVTATQEVTFTAKDKDDNDHEVVLVVSADDIAIDIDRFDRQVDSALDEAVEAIDTETVLVAIAKEAGIPVEDIDESTLEVSERGDPDFSSSSVTATLSGEVKISGYRAPEVEEIDCYYYPIENAIKARLVLDFNEMLTEEYGEDLGGKKALEAVLNLDLAEVEDPEIFRFFFGLAEHLRATPSQLRKFKNRVTLRGDLPRDIGEREYLFDSDVGFSPELRKKGYIVNPAEDLDFQAIGRELYGDLVDLD
jgi:hypothetical protein